MTKNLAEHGEKLDDETKKTVQDAIDSAKTLDSSASVETLKVGHVWTAYAYDFLTYSTVKLSLTVSTPMHLTHITLYILTYIIHTTSSQ